MSDFKFQVINPLLHSELRLKIMVALDSLESADFMYLCQITDSTRGNVSTQITTLKDRGVEVGHWPFLAYHLQHHPSRSRSPACLRGRPAPSVQRTSA